MEHLIIRIKNTKKELLWRALGLLIGLLISPVVQLLFLLFQSLGQETTSIISTLEAIMIMGLVVYSLFLYFENRFLYKRTKELDPGYSNDNREFDETFENITENN
ncbi:hypothetical protein [Desulfosediminicola ganghwensis]|uniref:hypothetical protein n=1 Tax=Desulfosediminicola ganghwensis TaxID=2569540 RepID=UPI0010AC904B|nr:hypothetical protein [Desulfosediminicola ganghwensis]